MRTQVNLAVQETLLDAAVLGAEGLDFDDFARLLRADSETDLLSLGSPTLHRGTAAAGMLGLDGGSDQPSPGFRRSESIDLYDARLVRDGSVHGPAAAAATAHAPPPLILPPQQPSAAAAPQPTTGPQAVATVPSPAIGVAAVAAHAPVGSLGSGSAVPIGASPVPWSPFSGAPGILPGASLPPPATTSAAHPQYHHHHLQQMLPASWLAGQLDGSAAGVAAGQAGGAGHGAYHPGLETVIDDDDTDGTEEDTEEGGGGDDDEEEDGQEDADNVREDAAAASEQG